MPDRFPVDPCAPASPLPALVETEEPAPCDVPRYLGMCLRCFTMKNKRAGHPWCDRCMDDYEPPVHEPLPVGYEPRVGGAA